MSVSPERASTVLNRGGRAPPLTIETQMLSFFESSLRVDTIEIMFSTASLFSLVPVAGIALSTVFLRTAARSSTPPAYMIR